MRVMMVGGGTGGHIYPAIAIAQTLQDVDIDSQILFVGSSDGIETKIVPKERFSLATIRVKKMMRKLSFNSLIAPFYILIALFDSFKVINKFKPQVIIATGGFVSLPVSIAGFIKRIPIVLHEGNVTPGLSTRICKWFASRIIISFEDSRKYYRFRKVFCMGGPVRKEILKAIKGVSMQHMNLKQDKKTVLILGGSQGALSINRVIVDTIPKLRELDIQVIHVCGDRDYEWVKTETEGKFDNYNIQPYMYNIWDGLASADVVVTRAGATAISEILVRAIPSIVIPFPYSAGNHQEFNAKLLERSNAAILLHDKDLNPESLSLEIKKIISDRSLYANMQGACRTLSHPNSALEIVNMLYSMLKLDLVITKTKKKRSDVRKPQKKKEIINAA